MIDELNKIPFALLRLSLGLNEFFEGNFRVLSEVEWQKVHDWAVKSGLIGVVWCGVQKLPAEFRPPHSLILKWSFEAENIRGLNKNVNSVAVKLTRIFEEAHLQSMILNGPANALLYPAPSSRQTGDVDIWVEGGRQRIEAELKKMGMHGEASFNDHHVGLNRRCFGADVEIHYVPMVMFSPFSNKRLQFFFDEEYKKATLTETGFYTPSIAFALVMQLAHIMRHFIKFGIGLRQVIDYYHLLITASDDDRRYVGRSLEKMGLSHMAGAVMWVLKTVLGLDEKYMICSPDERRGRCMLKHVMEGGNFGNHSDMVSKSVFQRWILIRIRKIRLFSFDFSESVWSEIRYWLEMPRLLKKKMKS